MPPNDKAVSYARSPQDRNKSVQYEKKFASLIKLCETGKAKGAENLVISWPWVLGDTYEEVIESLSRIAEAGLVLHIVERADGDHMDDPGVAGN